MGNQIRLTEKGPDFRRLVRAARLQAEGKVCYACGRKLPKKPKSDAVSEAEQTPARKLAAVPDAEGAD